eukprot:TRINITY_DN66220_c3_g2_i1.p1 TRINITY_DN66220_c3_g2~~TRINITY_DN66220_c3_g2_i1.p1  ORF type:complete len:685 (-),score=48.67 TRINITY_DN66220_c3_g2_i1:1308-3362(-)
MVELERVSEHYSNILQRGDDLGEILEQKMEHTLKAHEHTVKFLNALHCEDLPEPSTQPVTPEELIRLCSLLVPFPDLLKEGKPNHSHFVATRDELYSLHEKNTVAVSTRACVFEKVINDCSARFTELIDYIAESQWDLAFLSEIPAATISVMPKVMQTEFCPSLVAPFKEPLEILANQEAQASTRIAALKEAKNHITIEEEAKRMCKTVRTHLGLLRDKMEFIHSDIADNEDLGAEVKHADMLAGSMSGGHAARIGDIMENVDKDITTLQANGQQAVAGDVRLAVKFQNEAKERKNEIINMSNNQQELLKQIGQLFSKYKQQVAQLQDALTEHVLAREKEAERRAKHAQIVEASNKHIEMLQTLKEDCKLMFRATQVVGNVCHNCCKAMEETLQSNLTVGKECLEATQVEYAKRYKSYAKGMDIVLDRAETRYCDYAEELEDTEVQYKVHQEYPKLRDHHHLRMMELQGKIQVMEGQLKSLERERDAEMAEFLPVHKKLRRKGWSERRRSTQIILDNLASQAEEWKSQHGRAVSLDSNPELEKRPKRKPKDKQQLNALAASVTPNRTNKNIVMENPHGIPELSYLQAHRATSNQNTVIPSRSLSAPVPTPPAVPRDITSPVTEPPNRQLVGSILGYFGEETTIDQKRRLGLDHELHTMMRLPFPTQRPHPPPTRNAGVALPRVI